MTRTGKSNTTKIIASGISSANCRKQPKGRAVDFRSQWRYANENAIEQGCLKNIANILDNLNLDVVTYGLHKHPNDPDRNITKFNFFGATVPSGKNPGKQELDEALQSLYQGKQVIDEALREETGGYIKSFINADIAAA